MSTLYVSEYTELPTALYAGYRTMAPEPPIVEYTVPISGSPNQSQAFSGSTNVVRIHCDTVCSILFGLIPTATTSNKRLATNQTEYFSVTPGSKVSVIANV